MKYLLEITVLIFALCLILFIFSKEKKQKTFFLFISVMMVVGFCLLEIKPLFSSINYGLDLQGGFEVLYEVQPISEKEKLDSEMVYSTYSKLLKRIDILGVSEPEITIEGDNHIRIRLAGITNQEETRNTLEKIASLTFRDTSDNLLMTSDVLGGNSKVTTDSYGKPAVALKIKDVNTFYNITNKVKDYKDNRIVIWLDYEKGDSFFIKDGNATKEIHCDSLTTSKCLSAASVKEAFASDVIISGSFTQEEAQKLVELINSGAMPTKLHELSSRTVEASFGANSLNKTIMAGIIGIIVVITMMIVIYHFSGFIASVGIVLYTFLSFLIFYLINGVLTLPGIAAMLLGIGMAVDASVISFERVKEELRTNNDLSKSFKVGNKHSLSSIIDANITTIIVAIILFIFGESSIKGFATMLIISIIITVLVMVFLVKLILSLFVKNKFFHNKLNLFIGYRNKNTSKILNKLEFVKNRKYFLTVTLLIIVIGVIFGLFKGINLGVDFKGGTNITLNTKNQDQKELINYIEDNYKITKIENYDNTVSILIDQTLSKEKTNEISKYYQTKYNVNSDINTVSQVVKQKLIKNGIYSVLLAFLGIILYVAIRFKFSYAVSGIIALVHDVLMTFIFFIIFKIEITTVFIAAILTIIGYSINDTIVTFDRIRENVNKNNETKNKNKQSLEDIVNISVRQTLFRTILTTITTIIPVICLMIFGAYEIINFNIALLVGFIFGVYSSIYISNQLWLIFEKRLIKKPKKIYSEPEEISIKGINS